MRRFICLLFLVLVFNFAAGSNDDVAGGMVFLDKNKNGKPDPRSPGEIHFPLYESFEEEKFSVLFFADTQARGLRTATCRLSNEHLFAGRNERARDRYHYRSG